MADNEFKDCAEEDCPAAAEAESDDEPLGRRPSGGIMRILNNSFSNISGFFFRPKRAKTNPNPTGNNTVSNVDAECRDRMEMDEDMDVDLENILPEISAMRMKRHGPSPVPDLSIDSSYSPKTKGGKEAEDKDRGDLSSVLVNDEERGEFEREFSQLSISIDETMTKKEASEAGHAYSDLDLMTLINSEVLALLDDDLGHTRKAGARAKEEELEQMRKEIARMKKILELKEELRRKEKAKEAEAVELKNLEGMKILAQLEYERKRRRFLEQELLDLKEKLEKSEMKRERMKLSKYCKLPPDYRH